MINWQDINLTSQPTWHGGRKCSVNCLMKSTMLNDHNSLLSLLSSISQMIQSTDA
jgi:hypothetical protein